MLLNLINEHCIASEGLGNSDTINIFDSSAEGYATPNAHAVGRVELFAEGASRFQRAADPIIPDWDGWTVDHETSPRQDHGDSCGELALAHLWCAVEGRDLRAIHCVGDQMRLALMHTLLERGRATTMLKLRRARLCDCIVHLATCVYTG